MQLIIGNKAYSSWSMRPWIALKHLGIPFEDKVIPLDHPETREEILKASPAGRVPVLKDGGVVVWETLAILDYVDRFYAMGRLWPEEMAAHGLARAVATEMHGGFPALRNHCQMNIRRKPALRELTPEVRAEVARIEAIWTDARQRFGQGGPFLFGKFSAADAMYAPVVSRFHTYLVPVNATCRAYMEAMMATPAWQAWTNDAFKETWVIEKYED